MLFWMDLEMTGLDPNTEVIVEIATVVTDDDLTVLAEGPDVVIATPAQFLEKMDPFVLNMHTNSGLLEAIQQRLKQIGVPLKRVHSVIITHSHPDHFGGAARIRDETQADIITHRLFRMWWDPSEPPDLEPEELAIIMSIYRKRICS